MFQTSWKSAESKLGVPINGVIIPMASVPQAVMRFVRPAAFWTGDETWELQFSGTIFIGHYRRKTIAIASGHQAEESPSSPSPRDLVILSHEGERIRAVSPHTIARPLVPKEEHFSLCDLCVYVFDENSSTIKHEKMQLDDVFWSDKTTKSADYSFLIGYPTDSRIIETTDEGVPIRFVNRWIRQDLQHAEPRLLDIENRNIFVKHEDSTRLSVNPDGLSGSPVFSIQADSKSNRNICFEGIITDAVGDRFAVYPSIYIKEFIDHLIDSP